jgi:hypothetical protein
MSEEWVVTRTKDNVTEFLCKDNVWHKDKKKALPLFEEYAKGTANGLGILESGLKGKNPYRYDTEVAAPTSQS